MKLAHNLLLLPLGSTQKIQILQIQEQWTLKLLIQVTMRPTEESALTIGDTKITGYSEKGTNNKSEEIHLYYKEPDVKDGDPNDVFLRTRTKWQCRKCGIIRKCDLAAGNGNLWQHLRTEHNISSSRSTKKVVDMKNQTTLALRNNGVVMNKEAVQKAHYQLAKIIVNDLRPISLGSSNAFREFCYALNHSYETPSDDTMTQILDDYYSMRTRPLRI